MSARIPRKKPKGDAAPSDSSGVTPPTPVSYVVIGQVGRPHGLRGAFFVSGREGVIEPRYGELRIGVSLATASSAMIVSSSMQAGRPLLVCSLASDRNGAAALTGQLIYADKSRIEAQRGDNVLWSDLEGAEVVDAEGVVLGLVHHVYNAGASDIIEVRAEGRSVDIPLIEDFVRTRSPLAKKADTGRRRLQLKVKAETFTDVWNDQTKGQTSPLAELAMDEPDA